MSRIIKLNAKCSDCCFTEVPHLNFEKDGYVPHIDFIGGGDYIQIKIDLDTGKVINFVSYTDEELKEALNG